MPKVKKPRKGSLAFYPRKRAKRIYPTIRSYPSTDKPKLLAFAGYKAGMLHVMLIDNRKGSPSFGEEIVVPATVLECPPLKVLGIRAYQSTTKGLKVLNEGWAQELPKDLVRKIKVVQKKENLMKIENSLDKISNMRLIVSTQPRLSGIGKKRLELFEIEVGGKAAKEKIEFAKSLLGKEINVKDVIREGELVDAIGITKGKGFEGPVKRFGVKIQTRHAKKKKRHIGTLGPQHPARVKWTVAQAGQLGFQRRTELNKRILKIGEGKEVTPEGGLKRYGIVKSDYALLEGSVPGAKKRLVMVRAAIRPNKVKLLVQEVKEIVK